MLQALLTHSQFSTQAQLAEALGVHTSAVSRWLAGRPIRNENKKRIRSVWCEHVASAPPQVETEADNRLLLLHQNLRNYRRLDDLVGAREVIDLVAGQIVVVRGIVYRESNLAIRLAALRLLGEHYQLIAWLSLDVCLFDISTTYYGLAMEVASNCEDHELARYIAGWRAFACLSAAELTNAQRWLGFAKRPGLRRHAHLEAWLEAVTCRVYAARGDTYQYERAVEQAHMLLVEAQDNSPDERLYHFSSTALMGYQGAGAVSLGRANDALPLLTKAIESLPPSFVRARGVYKAHLMHGLLLAGDADEAVNAGLDAVNTAIATGSTRCAMIVEATNTAYRRALPSNENRRELEAKLSFARLGHASMKDSYEHIATTGRDS